MTNRILMMLAILTAVSVADSLFSQERLTEVERLKRELDLQRRELELLRRENDLLKREAASRKSGTLQNKTTTPEEPSTTRVTVNDVDYVYAGTTRASGYMLVTILATSRNGDQPMRTGHLTLIDPDGEQYRGLPTSQNGLQSTLKEGVTLKLTWKVGGLGPFGQSLGPVPPTRVTRFAAVTIEPNALNLDGSVEFRNVPATKP